MKTQGIAVLKLRDELRAERYPKEAIQSWLEGLLTTEELVGQKQNVSVGESATANRSRTHYFNTQ